ncbi:MarR family transcriptional regulator [Microbacterium betulae]|uniref:MarR family transcriptional regulator n=1 Tax=Microbacterium betulae TaxID=2981139 RepID=A0AA97FI12_9MICO|nr:MarR family transcriptional regulator [Microbacterium sp. AB]WOF22670.1 MarR family transcriptional regulator [Microbacterium sp. AB]
MGQEKPVLAEEQFSMLDPRILDPDGDLVRRAHLSDDELAQVVQVLESMRRWRETERTMSEASRRYMKLGDTDMRALRYLIAARSHGAIVTPSSIAAHLGISTASTTKLLDRLAAGRHIRRLPHPTDRRSLAIEVTEETRVSARASVGRTHARRFDVAAGLSAVERETVIRFFETLVATAPRPLDEEPSAL